MDLSRRSELKELLDRDDIPFGAIERNMRELDIINSRLGGHAITLEGFKRLMRMRDTTERTRVLGEGEEGSGQAGAVSGVLGVMSEEREVGRNDLGTRGAPAPLLVAEIGCGGGDNLLAIRHYCKQNNREVQFIGVDLNPHCIAVAASKFSDTEARWITADYRTVSFEASETPGSPVALVSSGAGESLGAFGTSDGRRPDIVFSSLFCHHFGEDELVGMLRWMRANSVTGFFINDLHRHVLAYQSIRILVSLFSRSYLVKHDAPLSVLRGFRRAEWEALLQRAGIEKYTLEWKWAFRWLLIANNANNHTP